MEIDLIASIELTASSAIAIAVLAAVFGKTAAARVRIAGWLAAWFAVVSVMAAIGFLSYPDGLGTPGLRAAVTVPIVLLIPACLVPLLASTHLAVYSRLLTKMPAAMSGARGAPMAAAGESPT